jgi:hypothetical protein
MRKAPAHEVLRRVFDVVVSEAKTNEVLANKLLDVLGDALANRNDKPAPVPRQKPEPVAFHAINVLRSHGESALRGKLEQVRAADRLRAIANISGLVLAGGASKTKASCAELIDGIIAAAKHYDSQRETACAVTAGSPPPPTS